MMQFNIKAFFSLILKTPRKKGERLHINTNTPNIYSAINDDIAKKRTFKTFIQREKCLSLNTAGQIIFLMLLNE